MAQAGCGKCWLPGEPSKVRQGCFKEALRCHNFSFVCVNRSKLAVSPVLCVLKEAG